MILRSKLEEGKDLSSQHSLRPGTLPLYKLVFVGGPVLPRLMTSSEIREDNGSPWGCLLEGQEVVAQETALGDNAGTSCHCPHGHKTQKSQQVASFCGSCVPNTTIITQLLLLRGKTV